MIKPRPLSIFFLLTLLFLLDACKSGEEPPRERMEFNDNWKFILADSSAFSNPGLTETGWREVTLPHDWSIEGPFSADNPSGPGGGYLPGGIGWYRKSFRLPEKDSVKRIFITFDAIYMNSDVYINGHFAGNRPNGYIGFQYDITPWLNFGNESNVIAVRVDNSKQPNSRWYSGSGIYRNVWLEKTDPVHVEYMGTHILTKSVSFSSAVVEISARVNNASGKPVDLQVKTLILDPQGSQVTEKISNAVIQPDDRGTFDQQFNVDSPDLWSPDTPELYRAVHIISMNNKPVDRYETTFGIRDFRFDREKGFFVNGKATKILGVCNHHDLGALGSAVNERAIERQLEILKNMGCNAIRTSHNPPAPELLDLCDRMGFLVMDESFDMWKKRKTRWDYATYWDEWHVRDLTDHLLRDRNHPCIFSWSIGNEIIEQTDSSGMAIATELADIVKDLAPGIPVTGAFNHPDPQNFIIQSGALDLIGFNYHHEQFTEFRENFPGKIFIASETTSALQTRGSYDMPSDSVRQWPYRWDRHFRDGNPDNSCSSYDNCHTPWGSTHESVWKVVRDHDYLSGLFVWTGFDYLGEPTPYAWPSRSSYFGIVDLAGFPKDVYYMYQSEWTGEDVLHIFPHWNWEEGQLIDIWAYSSFPEVELFINGESQGAKVRGKDDLHLQWRVRFTPGTLSAIGRKPDGTMKEVKIVTAGDPAALHLEADRSLIKADGKDLSFVTITLLDDKGVPVPVADNPVQFEVSGSIDIAGVDNGNQTDHTSFRGESIDAFNGKCLVILRSNGTKGTGTITARSEGLSSAKLEIHAN